MFSRKNISLNTRAACAVLTTLGLLLGSVLDTRDAVAQLNVALGQPTAQSTDGFGFDGSNAVNGNLGGNDITHTDTGDIEPWWEVDLGSEFPIDDVQVYNRTACCGERLYNISIEVFDELGASVFTSSVLNPWDGVGDVPADPGAGPFGFDFIAESGGPVTGQRVRVNKGAFSGSEWLSLVEVEVNIDPTTAPIVSLTVDRATGAVTLFNNTASPVNILGYSLTSSAGSFNQANWTTIDGNYDAAGDGSVDSDNNWGVLTSAGVDTDLSEAELAAGDGGVLAVGQSVDLGTPWRLTPFEDVVASILLVDGTVQDIAIAYSGATIEPGDLNGIDGINAADWSLFKAGQGADFSGLSQAASYSLGDMDSDGDHDLNDFSLFEEAFDLANGDGALAALTSAVPEPSALALLILAGVACCTHASRRHGARLWVMLVAALLASSMTGVTLAQSIVALNADAANSSAAGFGSNLGNTLNDGFAYNPLDPTGTLPVQVYSGAAGFHGNEADGVDVFLSYTFASGAITLGAGESFFLDLYSRSDCCFDRDDNIDIELYSGGVTGTLVGSAVGQSIPDEEPFYQRIEVGAVGDTFDSFRIVGHDSAPQAGSFFTLLEARAALFSEGVDPFLSLTVNTITGNITLENNTVDAVELDSYQIVSPGVDPDFVGSLNPNGWTGISSQSIAGFPSGDGSGNGWEQGPNADANELVEWYLNDEGNESSMASGDSINLGGAYDTSVDGQDLEFLYRLTDGTIVTGLVNYDDTGTLFGDFEPDGDVDIIDFGVFADAFGSTGGDGNYNPAADSEPDSDVDIIDFGKFADNFGIGTLQSASVPEPTSLALIGLSLAGILLTGRRRMES